MNQKTKLTSSQQYFREIELHWSLQRGNRIIVSPLEFDSVMEWYEKPVPLKVVLRAIDQFLDRKKKNKRKRNHLLSHISADVEKLHKEFNLLHLGSFDGSSEPESMEIIPGKLKSIRRKVRMLQKECLTDIESQLTELISEKNLMSFLCYEDLETALQALDQQMMAQIETECSEEQKQLLKDELKEFLDEEKDEEFFQKAYNDLLRVHFDLPRISVLG